MKPHRATTTNAHNPILHAPRLRWESLGVGDAAYHAAFFAIDKLAAPYRIGMHRHDFFEMLFLLDGAGQHPMLPAGAGPAAIARTEPLAPGDLIFLRPNDCHGLQVPAGGRLHWINIAFPAPAWTAFRMAAGMNIEWWDGAAHPPIVNLPPEGPRETCTRLFEQALNQFQTARVSGNRVSPNRLDLCGFLAEVVRYLRPSAEPDQTETVAHRIAGAGPPWLIRACTALTREMEQDMPAVDAERLTTLAGVSPTHVARTLKAATGQTPTEYVNGLRLARAALLLTTTAQPIADIAAECGFGQLSYFYRLFGGRFGMPPDAYRRAAREPVAP